jgi:hypothetical protein
MILVSLRPSFLRWHSRQAVLAVMRGVEERIFEHDSPLGSDVMGQFRTAPWASERMEFEIYSRIRAHKKLDP